MNPWLILGAVVFWVASVGSAGWYGIGFGEDRIISKQASDEQIRRDTREAAQQGAADAIAQLKPVNTTIRAKTETIVRENTVYRTCINTPDGLRNINAALSGKPAEPVGGEQLPKAPAAK